MKRSSGLLAAIFLALPLAGCGGSAAPAAPIAQAPPPSEGQDQRARAFDAGQDFGSNSFPHILVKSESPGGLSKPIEDGRSITLEASATNAKGQPLSLAGANITWSNPGQGTIHPSQSGQSAVYTAPLMGQGHVVETVTVKFPDESQTYSASATIDFQRG
jgi:hypothetical protein